MAKHEGWDSELFVEPPSDNDLCDICCGVLDDAVETSCGHSFCEKCIKNWLEQRQVCPQDQKPLSWADCRPMVRDRRRILDLKVKCPWCETTMELRQLKDHRGQCLKKPADYEDEEEEPAKDEAKADEPEYVIELDGGDQDQKLEAKRIEEERKAREAKEAQERDLLFAQQMQIAEQERARNLSVRPQALSVGQGSPARPSVQGSPVRPSVAQQPQQRVQPSVQLVRPAPAELGGEPHIEDFGSPQNGNNNNNVGLVEYYQADEFGGEMAYEGGQEGQPDRVKIRQMQAKRSGCCGCSDRCWCCMCCIFWIFLLVLGVSIWFFGVSGTVSKVGL